MSDGRLDEAYQRLRDPDAAVSAPAAPASGPDNARPGLLARYTFRIDLTDMDWGELSQLYRLAPLGEKPPDRLATVFGNSMFRCFAYADGALVGAGRALADGLDAAYVADIAVHPDHQGRGLGHEIVRRLVEQCRGHRKITLYANPGTEPFYRRLGFLPMTTAMAIWHDPAAAVAAGLLRDG